MMGVFFLFMYHTIIIGTLSLTIFNNRLFRSVNIFYFLGGLLTAVRCAKIHHDLFKLPWDNLFMSKLSDSTVYTVHTVHSTKRYYIMSYGVDV